MRSEPDNLRPSFILVTCEHAGRRIPVQYRSLFRGAGDALRSHRGSDIGALGVAMRMASGLSAPLLFTEIGRLLVESNRSIDHPDLFSRYTRDLSDAEKTRILDAYYWPYRRSVLEMLGIATRAGHRVLHVGVHSFTDVLDGVERSFDIGLLFDPDRRMETVFCNAWRSSLEETDAGWRVRFNEPYLGIDDGLTTAMRTEFPDGIYAGIEVEIRQGLILRNRQQAEMAEVLIEALHSALSKLGTCESPQVNRPS